MPSSCDILSYLMTLTRGTGNMSIAEVVLERIVILDDRGYCPYFGGAGKAPKHGILKIYSEELKTI